jgi:hypothetical protein
LNASYEAFWNVGTGTAQLADVGVATVYRIKTRNIKLALNFDN